jgi:hypothetical protein
VPDRARTTRYKHPTLIDRNFEEQVVLVDSLSNLEVPSLDRLVGVNWSNGAKVKDTQVFLVDSYLMMSVPESRGEAPGA